MITSPIAIGGVGGSGTRLVASILQDSGFYIGSDLGSPLDNLWFSYLLKRQELWPLEMNEGLVSHAVSVFVSAMSKGAVKQTEDIQLIDRLANVPRLHHPNVWRRARHDSLFALKPLSESRERWGWKEPNTHIFLPALLEHLPTLKYIHVMRHGLDMALSTNQNQLVFWGPAMLDLRVERRNPVHSLRYWCYAHRRILKLGQKMQGRFLLLNFDALCANPQEQLPSLLEFIGAPSDQASIEQRLPHIKPPESIGRRRWLRDHNFADEDLELVESLGFSLN